MQTDGGLEELPFRLQGEELIDELLGVSQEVMVIVLIPVESRGDSVMVL